MKQRGSSDVKGSLWNHLDRKALLCHREAPLYLRVHRLLCFGDAEDHYVQNKSVLLNRVHKYNEISSDTYVGEA